MMSFLVDCRSLENNNDVIFRIFGSFGKRDGENIGVVATRRSDVEPVAFYHECG